MIAPQAVTQRTLFDIGLDLPQTRPPQFDKDMSISERFQAFHSENPHVYWALRQLALDMYGRGVRRYSMKGLFEILRWQYALRTKGEEFKLNNNYTALYARLLMQQEPELKDFFEVRERRAH